MRKSVFITGGSSGIGLELAKLYASAGHETAVCSFEPEAAARPAVPPGIRYYQADVTDAPALRAALEDFAAQAGRLDLVVANAGISMRKAAIPDFERGRRVIMTNVIGTLNTFEPAIALMKAQGGGQLAAVGSVAGTIGGLPGMAIYGASKAAIVTLCESFEIDLHRHGIQVTTLAPGFVDTPMTRENRHKKPFELSQAEAGLRMFDALEARKGLYLFPLPLKVLSSLCSFLPRRLYKAIMKCDLLGFAH